MDVDSNFSPSNSFEFDKRLHDEAKYIYDALNNGDINLNPDSEYINTELIMDGRILEENLKRKGLDLNWLQNQITNQGYNSAKDIFLGICDNNNQLTLYKYE